jgi:hypothetical protein
MTQSQLHSASQSEPGPSEPEGKATDGPTEVESPGGRRLSLDSLKRFVRQHPFIAAGGALWASGAIVALGVGVFAYRRARRTLPMRVYRAVRRGSISELTR